MIRFLLVKRSLRRFAVPALLALAACGGGDAPGLPPLAGDARILAFGDSITHGTGAKPAQAYPAQLSALIGREVLNYGTPGDETRDGLRKLAGALDDTEPDLLILCLGGNDFLRKRKAAEIRANLERLLDLARERGVPVLLLGVPEPKLLGLEAHALYAELAAARGLAYEGEILARVLGSKATKSDPIHPNARGYRMIAEAIAEQLRRRGAL